MLFSYQLIYAITKVKIKGDEASSAHLLLVSMLRFIKMAGHPTAQLTGADRYGPQPDTAAGCQRPYLAPPVQRRTEHCSYESAV